jgi:hypothetical protein
MCAKKTDGPSLGESAIASCDPLAGIQMSESGITHWRKYTIWFAHSWKMEQAS